MVMKVQPQFRKKCITQKPHRPSSTDPPENYAQIGDAHACFILCPSGSHRDGNEWSVAATDPSVSWRHYSTVEPNLVPMFSYHRGLIRTRYDVDCRPRSYWWI